MAGYLIDPSVVGAFLTKPYDLKAVWDLVAGQAPAPACVAPPAGPLFYTDSEKQYVLAETDRLYDSQRRTCAVPDNDSKRLVLSAGGPGAGKTTLLEQLLAAGDPLLRGLIFADPDERALKLMTAFIADIDTFGGGAAGLALSYTKWRWASNYISGAVMNRACADGYGILHGTTATSPQTSILYDNAHREGYKATTILVAAPEDVRTESARRRFEEEQTRYTADTAIKGRMFYDRLPMLLEKTDDFRLYWRRAAQDAPVLAAEGRDGTVTVLDAKALSEMEADCAGVAPDLIWEKLAQHYRIAP